MRHTHFTLACLLLLLAHFLALGVAQESPSAEDEQAPSNSTTMPATTSAAGNKLLGQDIPSSPLDVLVEQGEIVVGAIVGGCILIYVVCIAACCVVRSKRKKKRRLEGDSGGGKKHKHKTKSKTSVRDSRRNSTRNSRRQSRSYMHAGDAPSGVGEMPAILPNDAPGGAAAGFNAHQSIQIVWDEEKPPEEDPVNAPGLTRGISVAQIEWQD